MIWHMEFSIYSTPFHPSPLMCCAVDWGCVVWPSLSLLSWLCAWGTLLHFTRLFLCNVLRVNFVTFDIYSTSLVRTSWFRLWFVRSFARSLARSLSLMVWNIDRLEVYVTEQERARYNNFGIFFNDISPTVPLLTWFSIACIWNRHTLSTWKRMLCKIL